MRDSDGVSSLSYFRFGMDDVCHLFPHQVRIVNISFSCISAIIYLTPKRAARVGNLDFRWSPDDPEPLLGPPHFSHIEALLETGARIETGEEVSLPMLRLLRQGSSAGGARPKCTVEWENALWIAKFPARDDTLNIPRIEYATLTLARECGMRIPTIRLQDVGERQILMVRRFDREKARDGCGKPG
jgi:serine/threonine-protein kinase HipA